MDKIVKSKLDLIVSKSFQREPFYASEVAENNAELNTKECFSHPLILKSMPARVRLELTNACNLNCIFCYRDHFKTDDRNVLNLDDIDILSPILKTAKFICLGQKAEPLASPHIVSILNKMSAFDSVFSLYSNGQLLSESVAMALIRNKINFLTLSVSAFGSNYAKFHRGGNWKKLVENITTLNSLKEKHNSSLPRLRLSFVVRTDTIQFLEEALDFVKTHHFSEGIQLLLFYRITNSDKRFEPTSDWERCKPLIDQFKAKALKANVMVDLASDEIERTSPTLPEEYVKWCYEPWESFNITPSGKVIPCGLSEKIMGDIHTEDPVAIWNNSEYRKFRSKMKQRPFNRDCIGCWHCRYVPPLLMGRKVSRANKLFDSYYRIGK